MLSLLPFPDSFLSNFIFSKRRNRAENTSLNLNPSQRWNGGYVVSVGNMRTKRGEVKNTKIVRIV